MKAERDKVYGLLGLAARAGKLCSGETAVEGSISSKKAVLVLLSGDASENTRKKFFNKGAFYHVPVLEYGEKDLLGRAIGKESRSCIAIEDAGFAKEIQIGVGKAGAWTDEGKQKLRRSANVEN